MSKHSILSLELLGQTALESGTYNNFKCFKTLCFVRP
jgi:hypothetical protein